MNVNEVCKNSTRNFKNTKIKEPIKPYNEKYFFVQNFNYNEDIGTIFSTDVLCFA